MVFEYTIIPNNSAKVTIWEVVKYTNSLDIDCMNISQNDLLIFHKVSCYQ